MREVKALKLILAAVLVSSISLFGCQQKGGKVEFKNDVDKVSYAIGSQIGKNFKDNQIESTDLNLDMFKRGIVDMINGKPSALSDSDAVKVMETFSKKLREKQEAALKKQVTENQAKASAFLAENSKKSGVTTLPPDSLQYSVIKEGTGPMPKLTDRVKVLYTGTLIDGTEFDSSQAHGGEPFEFQVSQMIQGWAEILPMMKVGSKWKVFVPAKLAYGERGMGKITPNSLLIFEIELLEITKAGTDAQVSPKGKARK